MLLLKSSDVRPMKRSRQTADRRVVLYFAFCVLSFAFAVESVAQPPANPPRPPAAAQAEPRREAAQPAPAEEKAYYLSYLLIGVAIAVGLMLVCRPSRRGES